MHELVQFVSSASWSDVMAQLLKSDRTEIAIIYSFFVDKPLLMNGWGGGGGGVVQGTQRGENRKCLKKQGTKTNNQTNTRANKE